MSQDKQDIKENQFIQVNWFLELLSNDVLIKIIRLLNRLFSNLILFNIMNKVHRTEATVDVLQAFQGNSCLLPWKSSVYSALAVKEIISDNDIYLSVL